MIDWIRTVWFILTLRCDEAERIRAQQTIGREGRAERWGERLHRLACRSCRRARRQLHIVDCAVDDLRARVQHGAGDATVAMPREARDRIRATLAAAEEGAGPAG